jgi:hypothetical protein
MGYPRLIDGGTRDCGAITPSATKRKWLNYAADQSVEGIELRPAFKDHQACSAEPWINGVDLNRYTEIFHPTTPVTPASTPGCSACTPTDRTSAINRVGPGVRWQVGVDRE